MHVMIGTGLLPLVQQVAAPSAEGLGTNWMIGGLVVLLLVAAVTMVGVFATRYKRCGANEMLIISGRGGTERAVLGPDGQPVIGADGKPLMTRQVKVLAGGGGAFIWPVFQSYEYLSLEPLSINVNLKGALSAENIRVDVPAQYTVAIGTEPGLKETAASRLPRDPKLIYKLAEEIIFGQFRQVVASLKIEAINTDRQQFQANISQAVEPELRKVGLILLNVNVVDIQDGAGYLDAIGKRAASEAIQKARGDVAEQEKKGEVAVAGNKREQAIQVAAAERDREIGLANAQKEQQIGLAQAAKEQEIGLAEAAKEREIALAAAKRDQEGQVALARQAERIAVADADAQARKGEAEAQAIVVAADAQLKIRQAEAYQEAETKQRVAQAEVVRTEHIALAKAAEAELERRTLEERVKIEAQAVADRERVKIEAAGEAARIIAVAEAEAQAVRVKLEAQAEGEAAILRKRAEALGLLVKEAGDADKAYKLLMIEQVPVIAKAASDAIANIKFDKITVWEQGGGDGKGSTSGFLKSLAGMLPPLMGTVNEIAGMELPSAFGKMRDESQATSSRVALPPAPSPAEPGTAAEAGAVALTDRATA